MNDAEMQQLRTLGATQPVPVLSARLVWTAVVDIEARRSLGHSDQGERFVVPIRGGVFWGGPGHESFRGRVLPGGADRQLLRPDGVKELRAEYVMETDDGASITVDNRVLVDESVQPTRYAMSHLCLQAPDGPHAWLNRRRFAGTLQTLRPTREAVLVRGYVLENVSA